jgi:hypothetical protein
MTIGLKGCLYEDKGEGTEKLALEMEKNGVCN